MADPTTAHMTITLGADTGVQKTLTAARKEPIANPKPQVATDDQTTRTKATRALMAEPIISRIRVPRAVTDDRTARMRTTGVPKVDSTTDRTKTPRAAMNDGIAILMVPSKVAMVDPKTNHTETPNAATNNPTLTGVLVAVMADQRTTTTVGPKLHTGATRHAVADRTIALTEAAREATVDLTITLALTANRRRVEVVRGVCDYPVRGRLLTLPQDTAALEEVTILSEKMTKSHMTQAVTVRDITRHTNRRVSRWRVLIPLAIPTLQVTPIPPEEVTVKIVG